MRFAPVPVGNIRAHDRRIGHLAPGSIYRSPSAVCVAALTWAFTRGDVRTGGEQGFRGRDEIERIAVECGGEQFLRFLVNSCTGNQLLVEIEDSDITLRRQIGFNEFFDNLMACGRVTGSIL